MFATNTSLNNSNGYQPELLEAYRRSDIRHIRVSTALFASFLTTVGIGVAAHYLVDNEAPQKAYVNGIQCASAAANTAFQRMKASNEPRIASGVFDEKSGVAPIEYSSSNDRAATQSYQFELRNCLAKGPQYSGPATQSFQP